MQRVDLQSDDKHFTIADDHIAVGQLHFAFAQGLDLPAFEHKARLKALLKEIIEGSFFVVGDTGRSFRFFGHGVKVGTGGRIERHALGLVYNPAQPDIL